MTRFVYEERTNAGVMKALGYTKQDATKQFVIFGICSGGIGSLLGVLLGTYGIPYILCSSLMANMTMPIPELKFNWTIVVIAVLLSLSCTVMPVLAIVHREFKTNAAQLLLPKPPSNSSRILLERVKFIWKRMSFIQKFTARNIFRYKKRMLMTIFGVIGSVALLCAGLRILSSVNDIEGRQFGDLIKYDVVVTKSEEITNDEQIKLDKILKSSGVTRYEDVYIKQLSQQIKGVDDEQDITIMATSKKSFAPLIDIKTKALHNSITLPKNGVVITEKLAKLLGVSKGDTFILNKGGKTYTVRVSEIAEMYAGHYIFVSDDYYSQVWGETPAANSYLVKVNEKSDIANVVSKFTNLEGVKGVAHNLNIIEQIHGVSKSLLTVMFVLTIMSTLLAIVILYNLTNINMVERVREISTVKVLGFLNKEATMYLYRETIVLSIVGIGLGLISGKILHDFIIAYVAPSHVMFTPNIDLWTYIVPSGAVIGVLCVLCVYLNRMIRKLNMLDALKSFD
ncbi:ABC transporter permease [Mogibacterium neglectum]|uniref:ABC transporter permease n=1 Tax=Mogibacterium neglectum TaxID=114528 RepID=UPI00272999E5|nr:ABC transporter permease [Mogibacterium neglectum]